MSFNVPTLKVLRSPAVTHNQNDGHERLLATLRATLNSNAVMAQTSVQRTLMKTSGRSTKGEQTRQRLIEASAYLIHRRGYAAVGLNDILKRAKAPKGVLYHHFPAGKVGIGVAAIEYSAEIFDRQLRDAGEASKSVPSFVEALGQLTADDLIASKFQAGCPLATVALETAPNDPSLTAACRAGFEKWLQTIDEQLTALGHTNSRPFAELLLTSLEGALAIARTQKDVSVVHRTASQLAAM